MPQKKRGENGVASVHVGALKPHARLCDTAGGLSGRDRLAPRYREASDDSVTLAPPGVNPSCLTS